MEGPHSHSRCWLFWEVFSSSCHSGLTFPTSTNFLSIFFFGKEASRSATPGYPLSSFHLTKCILLGIYKHGERDFHLHQDSFTWHPSDNISPQGLGTDRQESLALLKWQKVRRIRPVLSTLWSCWTELFLCIVSSFGDFQAWKNHFRYKPLKAYYCSEKQLKPFKNKFV